MTKSTRGPDNQVKRYLKRFPYLEEVEKEHANLGPIRVQRKSLKEIQNLLKALPNCKNVTYKFYDCSSDAIQFGYEEYCIFYLETHIDNLPVYSQTVVVILKEEPDMVKGNFNTVQLSNIEKAANKLHELLYNQVVEIDADVLSLIMNRMESRDTFPETLPEVMSYIYAARDKIIEFNYSWDEALGIVDIEYGYNPNTGKWDGTYTASEPELLYFIGKTRKDSVGFNSIITDITPISKEVWDLLPKSDLTGGAQGAAIYESEDITNYDLKDGVDCYGSLIGIVREIGENTSFAAIAFVIEVGQLENLKKVMLSPAPCISYSV